MNENKKHKPPLRCRIAAKLILPSPSAMLCKCALGRHHQTRRCGGCSANSGEIIVDSLQRGIEDGLKSPLPFKLTADGKAIEAEEPEWAEDCPAVIKAAPEEATLTAEVKINPDVAKAFTALGEAFTALGEACKQAAEALGKAVRAAADCAVAMVRGVDIAQLLKAAKVQAALKEAPPRVRHLAEHGKKIRTQKKNINRALRDYERRRRQKRDRT